MRTYARIQDGEVAELLTTDQDITSMFSPELVWVDVSSRPEVANHWQFDGTTFNPPPAPPSPPAVPTIAELQARIALISAQLAALSSDG